MIREIPPKSFQPDDIVLRDESVQSSINNVSSGDTIVVQRGKYDETISINKEVYIVGEEGSEIRHNSSEVCTINGTKPFGMINMIVNAVGQTNTADFGVCASGSNSTRLV